MVNNKFINRICLGLKQDAQIMQISLLLRKPNLKTMFQGLHELKLAIIFVGK